MPNLTQRWYFVSDVLSRDTQLVLISGVYANGKWETGFEKRSDLFFVKDAYAKNMTTLIQTGSLKYADLKELRAQAVAIPYVVSEIFNFCEIWKYNS